LASLTTAQLLIYSAQCIIEENKVACQQLDEIDSLTTNQKVWLAFLATRRDTIVIPTTNCFGYKFNRRDDLGVDPNRDFAYTRKDNKCFLTKTSRIIYEVMKQNIIQLVVTYHGGMVAIGYEWGSPNHRSPNDKSPDDVSYSSLGSFFSLYAGNFQKEKSYPIGAINSVIYPVDGGMEDWLYAEGWDSGPLRKDCLGYNISVAEKSAMMSGETNRKELVPLPQLQNSLRAQQQRMNIRARNRKTASIPSNNNNNRRSLEERNAGRQLSDVIPQGNRALVFLVETSDLKKPIPDSLGGTSQVTLFVWSFLFYFIVFVCVLHRFLF
jgi:hypothetical protein